MDSPVCVCVCQRQGSLEQGLVCDVLAPEFVALTAAGGAFSRVKIA